MAWVWSGLGILSLVASAFLLVLSAFFLRAHRTHFTIAFAGYTFFSGLQKLAGTVGLYLNTDPGVLATWLTIATWLWFPIIATYTHAVIAYAHPEGHVRPWLVATNYGVVGIYAVLGLIDLRFTTIMFTPMWYAFIALSIVLAALAVHRMKSARTLVQRTEAKYLVAYLVIGTSVTAEALYISLTLGRAALWEIATAYAIATLVMLYGVLRHEIFSIDLYAKRATVYSLVSMGVAGVFLVLEQLVQDMLSLQEAAAPIAALVAALLIAPLTAVARRVVDRLLPHVTETPEYLESRKREVYRAQLEVALADGVFTERETEVLRRARRRLGITETQHRRILSEISS